MERKLIGTWNQFGARFGIKTYKIVVNWDHIHVVIRLHSPVLYVKFIRALCGTLAKKFRIKWKSRPATRLAHWGKDFARLIQYLTLNLWESEGFIDYQVHRTRRLPDWLRL